jgi:hypothetical protein
MDISREGVRIAEFRQNHGQQNHFLDGVERCRADRDYGRVHRPRMTHFSAAPRLGDLPSGAWAYGQGAGSERSGVQGGHGHHGCAGAKRGLIIGEGAMRVSFTVGASSS